MVTPVAKPKGVLALVSAVTGSSTPKGLRGLKAIRTLRAARTTRI